MTETTTHADLAAFIARCLGACGMSAPEAAKVAGLMAKADLMGQEGHGVFRLPMYVRRIRAGGMNMTPRFRRLRERPATALIDGDNGMGHLVMSYAAELAMEKARISGVAWVGARLSNHAGPASLYAMMPARENMIGLYLAVGSANHMPP